MTNFTRFFLALFCFTFYVPLCHSQNFEWATQFSGTDAKNITQTGTDAQGNIYSVGRFQGQVDFDPGPGSLVFNSGGFGTTNAFIIKQSPSGSLLWAKEIGSSEIDAARAMYVSPEGYIDIVGDFGGTVDFDPGPGTTSITSSPNRDVFFLRLTHAGEFVFVKRFLNSPGNSVAATSMAVDSNGEIVILMRHTGTIDFDPGPDVFNHTALGRDMSICKFSAEGNFLWVKTINTTGATTISPNVIKTDALGNIYCTGGFYNSADFDPGPSQYTLTAPGIINGFVLKLSPSGNFLWAKQFVGGETNIFALVIDNFGSSYVAGFYEGSTDFDPGTASYHGSSLGDRDGFVVKLSDEGNFHWAKFFGNSASNDVNALAIDKEGNLIAGLAFVGTIDADPGPGITNLTSRGEFDFALVRLTSQGILISIRHLGGNAPDALAGITIDGADNVIICGMFSNTVDFDPGPSEFNLTSVGAYPYYDMFVARFAKANMITGITFNDANGDGVRQVNERPLANVIIRGSRNGIDYYAISDTNGVYKLETDTGSYNVNLHLPLYYTSIILASHAASFDTLNGQVDTANHFALFPSTIIKDLEVFITDATPTRPGFPTTYRITYTNNGTEAMTGSLMLKHDSTLTYIHADPLPQTNVDPILTWNFSDLFPSMTNSIDVLFLVDQADTLGQVLKSYATVNPIPGDFNPFNNIDSLEDIVTGSFDPNDKTVTPAGAISPLFVSSGNYLDYVIRFQNTGTDTAFLVVIKDTLSSMLDIASFKTTSASHQYSVSLKEAGIVEWRFNNILLPDSNVNEPRSHGFVRYRIKPKNNLVPGDQVKNRAGIYFDFNAPIITNETVNTVTVVTSVGPSINQIETKVFPNPANSELYIQSKGFFDFELYDISGRLIMHTRKNYDQSVLSVNVLPKGIYILEIKNNKGRATHKILVE